MKTFQNAKNILDNANFSVKELTFGSNGYPKSGNTLRLAYYNIDNFETGEKLAKEVGGDIELIFWRDGWQFAESKGVAFEAIAASADDYGDDIQEWSPESEFDYLKEQIENANTFDEISVLVKNYKELNEAFANAGSNEVVLAGDGRYFETIKTTTMTQAIDSKNFAIAVVIDSSKFE